jgi:putative oxidoreductase
MLVRLLEGVVPLIARISIGWIFFEAGMGKFKNLSQVMTFFQSIHIPFSSINAPLVALIEFVGGMCLLLGLWVRWVSIPLIVIMGVALLTAHADAMKNLSELFQTDVFLNILVLGFLVVTGAGHLSADRIRGR